MEINMYYKLNFSRNYPRVVVRNFSAEPIVAEPIVIEGEPETWMQRHPVITRIGTTALGAAGGTGFLGHLPQITYGRLPFIAGALASNLIPDDAARMAVGGAIGAMSGYDVGRDWSTPPIYELELISEPSKSRSRAKAA